MNRPSEASKVIIDQTGFNGDTAVILGSGLGGFTDALTDHRIIEYSNIPYYPKSTVEGHSGEMVIGKLEDKDLLVAREECTAMRATQEKWLFSQFMFLKNVALRI